MKKLACYSKVKKNLFPCLFFLVIEIGISFVEPHVLNQLPIVLVILSSISCIVSILFVVMDKIECSIGTICATFAYFIPLTVYKLLWNKGYKVDLKYIIFMYVILMFSQILGYIFFSSEWKKQRKNISVRKNVSLALIEGFPLIFISVLLRRSLDNSNMSVETRLMFLIIGLMVLMVLFSVLGIAYLSAPFKGVRMRIVDGTSVVTFEADNEK